MARSPEVLHDATPLDGPRVDVAVRVAWLLRISRAVGVDGVPLSVTAMAHRLKDHGISASAPSVSGWETGRVAPGAAVLEAYEAVLGRPAGTLRGAIDMTRRTFRENRPRPAPPAGLELSDLDRAAERVVAPGDDPVRGVDWLHFCEAALAVRPGLPGALVRPLVDRLLSELARSVFTGYVTRYEGLALLRCGQYADLVREAARDFVGQPGAQVVADAMSVVAERADPQALRLLLSFLDSDEPTLVRGAALGMENLAAVGGLTRAEWLEAADPFVAAFGRGPAGPEEAGRRRVLSNLWRTLPAALRDATRPRLPEPPEPLRTPRSWHSDHRNAELDFCRRLADRVCDASGVRRQPVLTRLLFEAAFDFRSTRSFTASLLLMASPFRGALATELASATPPDPLVRDAAAQLLVSLGHQESVRQASAWLESGDPALTAPALVALAHSSAPVAEQRLEALLEQPDPVGRRALYYAGMTGHPVVARLAGKPRHRWHCAARWWVDQGSVVTV